MILSYLEKIVNPRKSGDVYRSACPICGSHSSDPFIIFDESERYFCHSCGDSGDTIDLIVKLEGGTREDAAKKTGSLPKINLSDTFRQIEKSRAEINFSSENNYFLASSNDRAKELFDELISPAALSSLDLTKLFGLVGYDAFNDTLTVAIKDGERVVQIKRRKVGDKKWVGMYGSDGRYCPSRLTGKEVIYIASGMAEFLILQASGLDYIALQSDSINIPFDLSDKTAVIFEDNDTKECDVSVPESLRDGLDVSKANHFKIKVTSKINAKRIIPIDFQNMLDRNLEYGYDLRDFVNEYTDNWTDILENEITYWFKEELC